MKKKTFQLRSIRQNLACLVHFHCSNMLSFLAFQLRMENYCRTSRNSIVFLQFFAVHFAMLRKKRNIFLCPIWLSIDTYRRMVSKSIIIKLITLKLKIYIKMTLLLPFLFLLLIINTADISVFDSALSIHLLFIYLFIFACGVILVFNAI